jgi:hypothetical protein
MSWRDICLVRIAAFTIYGLQFECTHKGKRWGTGMDGQSKEGSARAKHG